MNVYQMMGEMIWIPILTYVGIVFLSTIWMYFWTERNLLVPLQFSNEQPPLSIFNSLRNITEDKESPFYQWKRVFNSIKFTKDPADKLIDLLSSPQEYLYLGVTLFVTASIFAQFLFKAKEEHCSEKTSIYPLLGAGLGFPVVLAVLAMLFQNNRSFQQNVEPIFLMLTAVGFLVTGALVVQHYPKQMPVLIVVGYVMVCRILYHTMFSVGDSTMKTVAVIVGFGIMFVMFVSLVYGNTYMDPTLEECPSG